MEHIINADIMDYGFLHTHSTCTNFLESVHDWSVALNHKRSIDLII
jgi:hypothetical protein